MKLKKIEENETETTIEKWDFSALKNALDDSIRKFIVSQKDFQEDHKLMDGRLLLSTLAILFSGYAIWFDWMHPFPESRNILIFCVIS